MRVIAILLLTITTCSIAGCEIDRPVPIDFDFQGIRIGDPVNDTLKAKFAEGENLGEFMYTDVKLPGFTDYLNLQIGVIDSKVESITLSYSELDFSKLRDAFIEKFGPAYGQGLELKWYTNDGVFNMNSDHASLWSEKYSSHVDQEIEDQENSLLENL